MSCLDPDGSQNETAAGGYAGLASVADTRAF
jgi:hypothetical protein